MILKCTDTYCISVDTMHVILQGENPKAQLKIFNSTERFDVGKEYEITIKEALNE